ncbi:MAG: DUF2283 domain-containing protein [Phycisphaerales bacterium]
MKIHYDPETDSLYLRIGEAPVAESVEVRPGVVLDVDDADHVIGIEVLHARRRFPDADVKTMQVELTAS